jgi:hypothetical protein
MEPVDEKLSSPAGRDPKHSELLAEEKGGGPVNAELLASSNPLPVLSGRKIGIAFRDDMRQAILEGRKCCTSRHTKKGSPGDFFILGKPYEQRIFRLTRVSKLTLDFVAHVCYRDEGTASPAEFIALWEELYPGRGFEPNLVVYTHFFEEVLV